MTETITLLGIISFFLLFSVDSWKGIFIDWDFRLSSKNAIGLKIPKIAIFSFNGISHEKATPRLYQTLTNFTLVLGNAF